MPANTSPIFPLVVQTSAVNIVNADGTNEKTLVTAGSNGTRVDVVVMSTTEVVGNFISVILNDGATSYVVGWLPVQSGAGTDNLNNAIKVLNLAYLPWLDASGSLFLKSGWTLKIAAKTAVAAGKTLSLVAFSGDY